ncbi:hypothetical protein J7L49_04600 [Candidatus Bathyarchaeota archaeon]|nr:hypothetical protein [Candidatus Bathyarchaeota archaeon]RJS79322.1 MAG: hypothetical protein CW708_02435 [Candidatus Bathyarchaeota archaeon]
MKCVICNREAVKKGYCELHFKAYNNIIEKYDVWKKSSEASWKEYLNSIIKNPLTGEWAREVAEYLIKTVENDVEKI